jgi:hypothetical protein
MSLDFASEIEKQLGEVNYKDPAIEYGYNRISLSNKISLPDKTMMIVSFLPVFLSLFYFPALITGLTLLASVFNIIFFSFGLKTTEIDFFKKEVLINYRWFITQRIAKLIKKHTLLEFHQIATFKTESFIKRGEFRKTKLNIMLYDTSPIVIAYFQFERDARKIGELLQFFILKRPVPF